MCYSGYSIIVSVTDIKVGARFVYGIWIYLFFFLNLHSSYVQRPDLGFGFNGGSYTMQPMYTAVPNYPPEFSQLGSTHGLPLSTAHQPQALVQHIPGPWVPPSPAGIGYGYPEVMSPFNPRQVGACSTPTLYLHSSQYSCQCHGMPFIPHEHFHQPFAQV